MLRVPPPAFRRRSLSSRGTSFQSLVLVPSGQLNISSKVTFFGSFAAGFSLSFMLMARFYNGV